MMTTNNSPLEFPCTMAIKVIGEQTPAFKTDIINLLEKEVPEFDSTKIIQKPSKQDRYVALTIPVRIDTREQLERIYKQLNANPQVKMTL